MAYVSLIALIIISAALGYLYLFAVASSRPSRPTASRYPSTRFIIAIPAHDEENVIEATVNTLRNLDYPADLFSIRVVADHCSDRTAEVARRAGAFVYERRDGPRTGKGAALSWLFERVLGSDCDAVVIFDSDTQVDSRFLRIMDARLAQGAQVVQGQHVISNPDKGWFPALTWAMFVVDNRFQNLGRSNLGCSAKNMGDSICFRVDVLRHIGWGQGLTEDYYLRQRLLLEGIKIVYEPAAKGYGQAPPTWALARTQRTRWLRGTRDSSRVFAGRLLSAAVKRRDLAVLEAALQAYLPSYSTLTVISIASLLVQVLINWQLGAIIPWSQITAWLAVVIALSVYPFWGLALEKAPLKAYLAISSGFWFVIWRTWVALKARLDHKPVTWVRTPHDEQV